eukprot:CAMPEP_0184328142 /NCGR_PEP_ID=MMETSP1049-20130417/143465_1 /TAXON_ID=77928 /ORGANISM="Proteomonas sulcata, Strain CCMP704" /LENGTH=222 /DNA_ID=CAMNT_0026650435 /DNA_START=1 /DNA_END=669 /DNA_ORIENTATION=-
MPEDPNRPGQQTGIGLGFEKRSWEPHFRIVAMNPSGTAALTGKISVDYFLLEVDRQNIDEMKSNAVIEMIKGDPGTKVKVLVRPLADDEVYEKPEDDGVPPAGERGATAVGAGLGNGPSFVDPLTQYSLPEASGPLPTGMETDREYSRDPEGMPEPFSDDEEGTGGVQDGNGGQPATEGGEHEEFFQSVLDDLNPFKPVTPDQENAEEENDPLDHEMNCAIM